MTQDQIAQLDRATARAVDVLRAAKRLEDVAPAVLEFLAQATGGQWAVDADLQRLRPIATWNGLGPAGKGLSAKRFAAPCDWAKAMPVWSGATRARYGR